MEARKLFPGRCWCLSCFWDTLKLDGACWLFIHKKHLTNYGKIDQLPGKETFSSPALNQATPTLYTVLLNQIVSDFLEDSPITDIYIPDAVVAPVSKF